MHTHSCIGYGMQSMHSTHHVTQVQALPGEPLSSQHSLPVAASCLHDGCSSVRQCRLNAGSSVRRAVLVCRACCNAAELQGQGSPRGPQDQA